ncbi:MAG TPA: tRNA (N(6)-L-threonylcarbamoyladenosine(37)-C(2))-methylthiotransferase MtaB [Micropepsaceae bacterium]|nr:tRNA (N(6)-L-threonylcarbamoyladenosine(37)-C(2))-methylthiotransferase MtaB [Micropepsaceae bacterium]
MSIQIVTLGCRLNAYESEIIRARATEAGLTGAVIVNTCAVTTEAVRQSRQTVRRLRRENPGAKIIVTGCAAQIEPERFGSMPEADLVIGNGEKLEPGSYTRDFLAGAPRVVVNDIGSIRETAPHFVTGFSARTRAVIQVQNGCDHRCTFCIIPYGRGPSRSAGLGAVVAEARQLCASGFREIVLSGVDLTAYGDGLPGRVTLGTLVAGLLKHVPELARIRLSSIDPGEVDELLLDLIGGEPRLMPHFHLSAQSGDNLILKRMKRRHSREDVIRFCSEVRRRRAEAAFGADLIAGFPTETEAMFENTLQLVDDAGLSYLHVFPFSPRKGTPAARMPQLDRAIVKDRAFRLRTKGELALASRLERLVGSEQELLVEDAGIARTPCFARARFTGDVVPGTILLATITGSDGRMLRARVLSPAEVTAQAVG